MPNASLLELVHTYSHANMVLPTGILKCGNCSAGLQFFQETVELLLLFFLLAALIQDLSAPSDSSLFLYIGVCPPVSLASHMIVLAVSAEKRVGERAVWKSWEEPYARWHTVGSFSSSLIGVLSSLGP